MIRALGLVLAAGLLLGGSDGDDPLTRPITGTDAARWLQPQGPAQVSGNTWYIGTRRIRQAVIDTGAGLVLIDAGLPESFGTTTAHFAALGLDLRKVRLILVTEAHYDHAGGVAALVRTSGARVAASRWTAAAMRRGISGADDPQGSSLIAYPPQAKVRELRDGQRIRMGSATITAHAMPGHTPGSMGYSWQSCDTGRCRTVLFAASLNPLATGSYTYRANPALVAGMRRTLASLDTAGCDILLTSHPEHSGSDDRLTAALEGKADAFASPGACATLARKYGALLDSQLP
ncbi:subclass B3 metallo-beta-lactamase [Novosphingobium sp. SL115]|uniref:subclass B3 metallo-beta-lactamase n=1 Tax=Novosphingobium sp. SL115 TaxID=2995150 RepID=UPI00227319F7|nr:subclass B3 metallo-beta-lactamase [Novosphingobium sp. SL115]MCY1672673.1 subclass B3 metallo-beta-lactamase [Novosphingobium sp. SL115]